MPQFVLNLHEMFVPLLNLTSQSPQVAIRLQEPSVSIFYLFDEAISIRLIALYIGTLPSFRWKFIHDIVDFRTGFYGVMAKRSD